MSVPTCSDIISTIGVLLSAVSAIASAISACEAKRATQISTKQYKEDRNQHITEFASNISCWRNEGTESKITVCNRNNAPAHDVIVSIVYPKPLHETLCDRPSKGEEVTQPDSRVRITTLPPENFLVDRPSVPFSYEPIYELEIAFRDPAGTRWIRRMDGTLERVESTSNYPYKPETMPNMPSRLIQVVK